MLAEIMGYRTPDYPKWTWAKVSYEKSNRIEAERNRWRAGWIQKGEYEAFKDRIRIQEAADYNFLYPRRPDHWPAVIKGYLSLSEDDRAAITRDGIRNLINYTHPDAVKATKEQEEHFKQAKAEARRGRNLPENKNQSLADKKELLWNDEFYPTSKTTRKPRHYTESQYDPEKVYSRLLKQLNKGEKSQFIKGLSKQIASDISQTLLRNSSLGQVNETTTEFHKTNGYQHTGVTPLGRKPTGWTRKLLHMK
jgi:hypothetical protein